MNHINNFTIGLLSIVFSFTYTPLFAQNKCIEFREIIESSIGFDSLNYDFGPELFPNYKKKGIFNDFWIKKKPIIVLCDEHIVDVKVKKGITLSKNTEVYEVIINLFLDAAKIIENTSIEYIDRNIAIEIEDKVVQIAMVVTPLVNPIVITFVDTKLEQILFNFEKVSSNVIVDK